MTAINRALAEDVHEASTRPGTRCRAFGHGSPDILLALWTSSAADEWHVSVDISDPTGWVVANMEQQSFQFSPTVAMREQPIMSQDFSQALRI